jgi:hypothetical protein
MRKKTKVPGISVDNGIKRMKRLTLYNRFGRISNNTGRVLRWVNKEIANGNQAEKPGQSD